MASRIIATATIRAVKSRKILSSRAALVLVNKLELSAFS